jgi:hypothetical protein
MSMVRSADAKFSTTPELYARLRKLAFIRSWTLSKCVHEVILRGLPLIEEELTEEEQAEFVALFSEVCAETA